MDKHQSIKRLGYGFSALVMALSTVAFVPSFNNAAYAEGACSVTVSSAEGFASVAGTVCLGADLTLEDILVIDKNTTIDLNDHNITQGADKNVLKVESGVTLTIVGNGQINPYEGKNIAGTGSEGTLVIKGGTFNGAINATNAVVTITGGTFKGAVSGKTGSEITGGIFSVDPSALVATTHAVYTDGVIFAVGAKTTYTATGAIYLPKGGDTTYNPGATPETVEGIANTISVVKIVDTDDSNKAVSTVKVEDGKLSVDVEAEAHNYQIQVKDASGATKWVNHVIVYTAEAEDKTVAVGDSLDLTTAVTGTNLPAGTTFALVEESEAAKIADDGVTFSATETGEYTVKYTLADANATTSTFKVSVTPATSSTVVARNTAKDGNTYTGAGDTYYDAVVPEAYAEVIAVENDKETGKASVTFLQPWFGDVSYTFGGAAQTLKLRVYSVESDVYAKVGDSILLNDLASFPKNVLARDGALLSAVTVSNGKGDVTSGTPTLTTEGQLDKNYYYHATAAGTDTVSWKLVSGATETTTIHTYDDDSAVKSVADKYVSLADGAEIADAVALYTAAGTTYGEVTFTVDDEDAEVDGNKITFTTAGEKTVSFTETFGDKTINDKLPMKVYVTGLETEDVTFATDASATITVAPVNGSVASKTIDEGLNVAQDGNEYTLTATEAGSYELKFTVSELSAVAEDGAKTYNDKVYTYKVTVTEPEAPAATLSVSEEDVSIEAGQSGTFTYTAENLDEGAVVNATSETAGIEAAIDGTTVTVTVAETVEAGEYTVTVLVEGTELKADKTITVTAKPVEPEPLEIVVDAGSDEMSAYVKGLIEDVLENGDEYTDGEGHTRVYNDKIELDVDAIEAAVAAGEKVVMVLVGEDISEYLSEFVDDATAFFTEGVGLMNDGESLVGAHWYNLVLRSSESGTELGEVYELEDGVEIALNIPEAYRTVADGYTRHFFVIRSHMGGWTRIDEDDLTIEDGVVSFMNDKFSAFYLGYYDTLNASVDTGIFTGESAGAHESSVAAAIVTLISAVVLAGAAKFAKAARK